MHIFIEPSPLRQKGQECGEAPAERASSARMLTPINCSAGMPTKFGQRAIHAQNIVLFVMHHDEVADGIEDFQPVPVGLLHAGKQAGILERDAGMAGNRAQQLLIFRGRAQRRDPPGKASQPVPPTNLPTGPGCNRSIPNWRRARVLECRWLGRRQHPWDISTVRHRAPAESAGAIPCP